MLSIILIKKIISLFIVMGCGIILVKTGIANTAESSILSKMSLYMIMPLVIALLGQEMLIYTSAYISVQQFLFWSHCKNMISEEKKISFKKIFGNINMIAIGIGLVIYFAHFHFPDFVDDGINIIAGMAGPVAMMVTGMLIGGMDFSKLN